MPSHQPISTALKFGDKLLLLQKSHQNRNIVNLRDMMREWLTPQQCLHCRRRVWNYAALFFIAATLVNLLCVQCIITASGAGCSTLFVRVRATSRCPVHFSNVTHDIKIAIHGSFLCTCALIHLSESGMRLNLASILDSICSTNCSYILQREPLCSQNCSPA